MRFRPARLQFSLRTLVILVVIVAALASWHGSRYARFRGRVAAKAELQERGVQLYTPRDLSMVKTKNLRDPESWLYRWDQAWFGSEAVWECTRVVFMHEYWEAQTTGQTKNVLASLQQFSEIQAVYIDIYGSDPFPPFDRTLLAGIMRLPNLQSLHQSEPGTLDQEWAEGLPEKLVLTDLQISKTKISPAVMLQILQKSPRLRELTIEHSMLDERVVEFLNNLHPNELVPADGSEPFSLTINVPTAELNLDSDALEPSLKQLTQVYSLGVQPDPFEKQQPNRPRRVFQNYKACFFSAWRTDNLQLQDFPQLRTASLSECRQGTISDCPKLAKLKLSACREFVVEKLPELEDFDLGHSDKISVRNCPKLKTIHAYGSVELAQLPSLTLFYSLEKLATLSIVDTPRLETVYLTDPTAEQLVVLSELPALRNLTLWFTSNGKMLPRDALLSLAKIPTLERLKIDDETTGSNTALKALLPELKALRHLRLLWLQSQSTDAAAIFDTLVEGESYLPTELEIFIGQGPLTDPAAVQERFPQLTYIDKLDPTPFGGKTRLDYFERLRLDDMPTIPELLKAMQQQVLDPKNSSGYGSYPSPSPPPATSP